MVLCSLLCSFGVVCLSVFFFQAEDGIRDLVRSRGLGDVYKRQTDHRVRRAMQKRIDLALEFVGHDGSYDVAWAPCLSLIHI